MAMNPSDNSTCQKQENNSPVPGILRMALPLPNDVLFDYLPCHHLTEKHLQPGIRYLVPYGPRKITGILVDVQSTSSHPAEKLKRAISPLDTEPVIDSNLFLLCRQVATYYHGSLGETLAMALPGLLRKGKKNSLPLLRYWCLSSESIDKTVIPKRAQKQQKAVHLLAQAGGKLTENELKLQGITPTILRSLEEKKVTHQVDEPVTARDFRSIPALSDTPAPELNQEQQKVLDEIIKRIDRFSPMLVHGVTGSGKTEVYLQSIARVLACGKQALVLVPEIGLTPQMVARFKRRFNTPLAILHSGMNDSERHRNWLKIKRMEAGIVICTRSGIFAPLPLPGLIVVDEEHDSSYKQQESIRYSARDIAILRGKMENIPVLLGSATPSLETLLKAEQGNYHYLSLSQRAGGAKPPRLLLEDIRKQELQAGLSQNVIDSIRATLQKEQQVLVFINRRGFAPSLICRTCGNVSDCPYCDAHMTLHRSPPHLHCHHCNHQSAIPLRCKHCHDSDLVATGIGTERTEMVLQEMFPDIPVIRIDRDSTRKKDSMHKMLAMIQLGKPAIIVGTQMLAKGHHFPAVTLVVIVNADAGFFSTDFRGEEKTAQLLLQVAGRAGRENLPGNVLVQTFTPDHPDLLLLMEKGYLPFARKQLLQRKHCFLPPYTYLALFTLESSEAEITEQNLHSAACTARETAKQMSMLKIIGPMPAPMEKKQGRFRGQLLFQAGKRSTLHHFLSSLIPVLKKIPGKKKCRWQLDVDPQEMF